jgi:hypothetical protein
MKLSSAFRACLPFVLAANACASAAPAAIEIAGAEAFPESVAAGPDGALYVGSAASGGVQRVAPGAGRAEAWIAPGAFGSRSTFGIYVDAKTSTLWVCSNDASGSGVAGPSTVAGSHLKAFDLATGHGKASYALPGRATLCNDIAVADDGAIFVTNSLAPQILRLHPGAEALEVFAEDARFQPPTGVGLDGVAIGGGNLYVDTFNGGELFRVTIEGGKAGAVVKLTTSRPICLPDALRRLSGNAFLLVEGGGSLDRVTISGDAATIETIESGLDEPTSVATIDGVAWVTEGQLSHLFDRKEKGPPKLPFKITPVQIGE